MCLSHVAYHQLTFLEFWPECEQLAEGGATEKAMEEGNGTPCTCLRGSATFTVTV